MVAYHIWHLCQVSANNVCSIISSMNNQDIQHLINKTLVSDPKVIAAYVFGSRAKKMAIRESDFDLAVVVKKKTAASYDAVYERIKHVRFPADLDLVIVDKESSPLLLFEIIRDGTCIYKRSEQERVNFEARALHTFYDTQHMRNIAYSYLPRQFTISSYGNR